MIAKRLAVMYLLLNKKDTGTICSVLKVSKGTVAKYALLLQQNNGILSQSLIQMIKNRKLKKYFEDLFIDIFLTPGTPNINWKTAWKIQKKSKIEAKEGL